MLTVTPGKDTVLSRGIVASIRDMIGYRVRHQRGKNRKLKAVLNPLKLLQLITSGMLNGDVNEMEIIPI